MNRTLERLQHEHRRLDRLIDHWRASAHHHEVQVLKRLRLKLKDRIFLMQRGAGSITS